MMKSASFRLLCTALLAAGVLTACEDDPILEPSQEKAGGGSYGRLTIDSTRNDEPSPQSAKKPNPALF